MIEFNIIVFLLLVIIITALILTWRISKKTPEYVGKTVTICLRDGFGLYNVRIENTEIVVLVKSKSGNLNYQWKDRHKIIDFRDNLYWIE